jgi:type III pantothenate kinase
MQAGIFYGAVGGVDALVEAVKAELDFPAGTPVVATGGLCRAIGEASRTVTDVDEFLTLRGIRIVHERWSSSRRG